MGGWGGYMLQGQVSVTQTCQMHIDGTYMYQNTDAMVAWLCSHVASTTIWKQNTSGSIQACRSN
jgi:hypothetical protein